MVWGEKLRVQGQALVAGSVVRGSQTAVQGQALPRPSVVRGEKLWSWVKRWWREMWSREPNCGFGSSPAPPECGPRREIMVFGSSADGGKYGPGRETAGLGQAPPRPSVVRGEKLWSLVKR